MQIQAPRLYNFFHAQLMLSQISLDCYFSPLINVKMPTIVNVKMPTIVGILTFMSRKNFMLSLVESEKKVL